MSHRCLLDAAIFSCGLAAGLAVAYLATNRKFARGSSNKKDENTSFDEPDDPLRLVRKAEAVIGNRTQRILCVLENCTDEFNHVAVLRTCESLGIQHVWLVEAPVVRTDSTKKPRWQKRRERNDPSYDPLMGTKRAELYASHLNIRVFKTSTECIAELQAEGRELWATDLCQSATRLEQGMELKIPERLAVVFGRECDGVSQEMLSAAQHRIYLPMYGFTESFNLGVSAALVLNKLLDHCPEARGDLSNQDATQLRLQWYGDLARNEEQRAYFEALAKSGDVKPYNDMRRPPQHRAQQNRNEHVIRRQTALTHAREEQARADLLGC